MVPSSPVELTTPPPGCWIPSGAVPLRQLNASVASRVRLRTEVTIPSHSDQSYLTETYPHLLHINADRAIGTLAQFKEGESHGPGAERHRRGARTAGQVCRGRLRSPQNYPRRGREWSCPGLARGSPLGGLQPDSPDGVKPSTAITEDVLPEDDMANETTRE